MAKKVTAEQLIALGVDAKEAKRLAKELNIEKPRMFKYVAFLTEAQAQDASTASGVDFERASLKYKKLKQE